MQVTSIKILKIAFRWTVIAHPQKRLEQKGWVQWEGKVWATLHLRQQILLEGQYTQNQTDQLGSITCVPWDVISPMFSFIAFSHPSTSGRASPWWVLLLGAVPHR